MPPSGLRARRCAAAAPVSARRLGREAVHVARVSRHGVEFAGRVLAEGREPGNLERLEPDAAGFAAGDLQAPDLPRAVVAVEVPARGGPHPAPPVKVAARGPAAPRGGG